MWPYWLMFLLPAVGAIMEGASQSRRMARHAQLQWTAVGVAVALLIGMRSRVGGDWGNYEAMLESWVGMPFSEAVTSTDPGFGLVSWGASQLDWGMVGVNMLTAPLFALALIRFCRTLPRPWLALAISVPYLVIVVGMGYNRQGVALACSMLGLLALGKGSVRAFVGWVLLGATFHKTVILLLPIAALVRNPNIILKLVYSILVVIGAYFVVLSDAASDLYQNYVVAEYQSEGALVRLLMNAVPAVVFLSMWRRFQMTPTQAALWRWFAWISLLLVAALFATNASTALDRVALYMLPMQVVVFSRLPEVLGANSRRGQVWVGAVLIYYAVVLFTWLNFASHSQYWIPYRFYLFEFAS